jgi:murein DD-endopeptidase MepM/ murein hydrolase activator NlpD
VFSRFSFFNIIISVILIGSLHATSPGKATPIKFANGFDFPIARPNAEGYYKSRGLRVGGHLGEDWLADGGSSHSFGQPVYNIGKGIVLLARDIHVAWGNVIVIRHAYLEKQKVCFADSLYAHLDHIDVKEGATVERGQKIGTIGNNHGMYPSHLHFEIHKNLNVGVNHTGFAKTLVNYWIPSEFIAKRRSLSGGERKTTLPITHFDIPSPSSYVARRHRALHARKTNKKNSTNKSRLKSSS